jgi:hypothetical protein
VKHIVFFLEEKSAEAFLSNFLPRIFPKINFEYHTFRGKIDLEKNVVDKLKAYKIPNTSFVILRDSDLGDCKIIKERLKEKCLRAGKPETLVRIACKALESWHFGDLKAVEAGLKVPNLMKYSVQKNYRNPDCITNPDKELIKITAKKYRKISGSREIAKYIDFENNTSHSFNVFIDGIRRIIEN